MGWLHRRERRRIIRQRRAPPDAALSTGPLGSPGWTSISPGARRAPGHVRRWPRRRSRPGPGRSTTTGEYPQDLFELFRDTGLLGLCIPEEYGGSGAGILGLTLAIEEVAKYSNTAALMLLLTRLPTGPGADRRAARSRSSATCPASPTGEQRAGFGLSEPQAGSDVVGMRTKAVPDGDDWVLNGTKCWMSGVVQADWYCVFAKTGAGRLAAPTTASRASSSSARWAGRRRSAAPTTRWACAASTPASSSSTTCACPPRTSSARSAASGSRCSASTRCARSSPPAASASPRARSCTRSST